MDPVTLVVTAVVLGASAGLKDTAAAVVTDAYAALKGLLGGRNVDVSGVERLPYSTVQRDALHENLARAGDVVDDDVLVAAQHVTDAVAAHDAASAEAIGVDLSHVSAEFLRVRSVRSEGTGVRVHDGKFSGGITIGEVTAGRRAVGGGDPPGR